MMRTPELGGSSRLVSLRDLMQVFGAASLAAAIGGLDRAVAAVRLADKAGVPPDNAADLSVLRDALDEVKSAFADLPLSPVVIEQLNRTRKAAESSHGRDVATMVLELRNNLLVELTTARCLIIPSASRPHYDQGEPAFGQRVSEVFPDASLDIRAATRFLALDESTACVFHLMRTLEHGLRALAGCVELPAEAMAHENWKNIIDRIEKAVRRMEGLPKTPQKADQLRALGEACTQFWFFKEAWRNHVSHSRAFYDLPAARAVWDHVGEFMRHVAGITSPEERSI